MERHFFTWAIPSRSLALGIISEAKPGIIDITWAKNSMTPVHNESWRSSVIQTSPFTHLTYRSHLQHILRNINITQVAPIGNDGRGRYIYRSGRFAAFPRNSFITWNCSFMSRRVKTPWANRWIISGCFSNGTISATVFISPFMSPRPNVWKKREESQSVSVFVFT